MVSVTYYPFLLLLLKLKQTQGLLVQLGPRADSSKVLRQQNGLVTLQLSHLCFDLALGG